MPMPKILLGFSPEFITVARHACKLEAIKQGKSSIPFGPYLEGILARSTTIQRAARAVGVKIPPRIPDARGKYERKT